MEWRLAKWIVIRVAGSQVRIVLSDDTSIVPYRFHGVNYDTISFHKLPHLPEQKPGHPAEQPRRLFGLSGLDAAQVPPARVIHELPRPASADLPHAH